MKRVLKNSKIDKSRSIIQMSNDFKKYERGVFNLMLYNTQNVICKDKNAVYTITTSDIKRHLGITKENKKEKLGLSKQSQILRNLNDLARGLTGKGFEIDVLKLGFSSELKETEFFKSGLLSRGGRTFLTFFIAVNVSENGLITYQLNPYFAELLAIKTLYNQINVSMLKNLTGKYTLALYEIVSDYKGAYNKQTPFIDLKNLRALLLGSNVKKYKEFKDFNKCVLVPTIKHINENTDIFIKSEFKRDKRQVMAVKFFMSYKQPYQLSLNLDTKKSQKNTTFEINKNEVNYLVKLALNLTQHKESTKYFYNRAWVYVMANKGRVFADLVNTVRVDYKNAPKGENMENNKTKILINAFEKMRKNDLK
jgi:hypothetical protein